MAKKKTASSKTEKAAKCTACGGKIITDPQPCGKRGRLLCSPDAADEESERIDRIARDTGRPVAEGGAYSSDRFANWRKSVALIVGMGIDDDACIKMLRSKHMRWCEEAKRPQLATAHDLAIYIEKMSDENKAEMGLSVQKRDPDAPPTIDVASQATAPRVERPVPAPRDVNVIDQASGDGWAIYNADCVEAVAAMPEASVDFSIFSPPFASLYTYSNSGRDMGNVRDGDEFAEHFAHLTPSLFRVLRPGRLMAVHCMLLPTSKTRDGYIGLSDFRGDLIKIFQRAGFIFHSEVTIWKNPVTAMQRTKALGLLHKTVRKDSAMSRTGIADFLVVMRKPGENEEAIAHVDSTDSAFPVERWQRYASPVWATIESVDCDGFLTFRDPHKGDRHAERPSDDASGIDPTETLQYMSARDAEDERHICPLQLGVIRRAIRLWTNPRDVVLSPFVGIASEGYVAIQEGRRFVGTELKPSYFKLAARNLSQAEPNAKGRTLSLFDRMDLGSTIPAAAAGV